LSKCSLSVVVAVVDMVALMLPPQVVLVVLVAAARVGGFAPWRRLLLQAACQSLLDRSVRAERPALLSAETAVTQVLVSPTSPLMALWPAAGGAAVGVQSGLHLAAVGPVAITHPLVTLGLMRQQVEAERGWVQTVDLARLGA